MFLEYGVRNRFQSRKTEYQKNAHKHTHIASIATALQQKLQIDAFSSVHLVRYIDCEGLSSICLILNLTFNDTYAHTHTHANYKKQPKFFFASSAFSISTEWTAHVMLFIKIHVWLFAIEFYSSLLIIIFCALFFDKSTFVHIKFN